MNFREDWGEYAAIFAGICFGLLGYLERSFVWAVAGLVIIYLAYVVMQQRGTIRELRQE